MTVNLLVSVPQSAGIQVTEGLGHNLEIRLQGKDEALGSLQQVQIGPGKTCVYYLVLQLCKDFLDFEDLKKTNPRNQDLRCYEASDVLNQYLAERISGSDPRLTSLDPEFKRKCIFLYSIIEFQFSSLRLLHISSSKTFFSFLFVEKLAEK